MHTHINMCKFLFSIQVRCMATWICRKCANSKTWTSCSRTTMMASTAVTTLMRYVLCVCVRVRVRVCVCERERQGILLFDEKGPDVMPF